MRTRTGLVMARSGAAAKNLQPACHRQRLEHVEKRLGGSPFFRQRLVEVPLNLFSM